MILIYRDNSTKSGWSPWNVDFMEDCNIIVQNFGLHYSSDGNHTNKVTGHSLFDDMLAAITYLSNFTASARRRIAVWRSALPQHFATSDGHYHGAWLNLEKEHTCSPIDKDATLKEQEYNNEYDAAFSKLCRADDQKSECSQYRHRCTVNPIADVEYQTIYNFWRANNCTHRIDNECLRLSKLHGQVTGTIYRWNIFNIFDVEWWHTDNMDCKFRRLHVMFRSTGDSHCSLTLCHSCSKAPTYATFHNCLKQHLNAYQYYYLRCSNHFDTQHIARSFDQSPRKCTSILSKRVNNIIKQSPHSTISLLRSL